MNKPSREDILRDLSSYVDGWWNPQVYLEAVYKKGWYTPEDFWNPQFDEQWNFIEETVEEVTNEWNDNWWQISQEPLTEDNANNYQRLNDYVKRYNELVRSKEEILNRYNWWEWYTPWSKMYEDFKSEIDNINSQLKDMENSDELASLLQSIKDNWLWAKRYESESFARNWLADIINWVWSSFEFNTWKDDANFMWQAPVKSNFKSMNKLIDTYLWNYKLNNPSSKSNKVDKKTWASKLTNGNDKFKDTKMVDEMSFWNDVKTEEYLERRNLSLAKHLKANWIETPEEIEEYLNKYPSWKDAPQKRKDNTVSILTDKVSKMKTSNNKQDDKWNDELNIKETTEEVNEDNKRKWKVFTEKPWKPEERKWKTFSSLSEKIKFDTDNDSPLNDEDTIYTYQWQWKDYSANTEEQTPENNKYLFLDETVKNLDTDAERIKYLEKQWYKPNKNGFYEKDGVKTRVYKDWRYNPKTEEIAKGWIWTVTKNINKSAQDEMDILLQEQGYNWPKDKEWHFIPMNEDILNWAWDKEETKKTKTKAPKKAKKEEKKETKKLQKVSKSSPTITSLLKSKK